MMLLKIEDSLEVDALLEPAIEVSAYPNPFIDNTIVCVHDDQNIPFELTIYSSKGDLVFTEVNITNGEIRLE